MSTTESGTKRVFICGSALQGQPDHKNLQSATFLKTARTIEGYRLHAAENGWHPAIYAVDTGGVSIPGEIYEMTQEQYEYLLNNEPPHMYPETVDLEGGEQAIAMLYPQELVEKYQWLDISDLGGWAAYKKSETSEIA
ncbi:AIG2-like family protein [Xenococcus sp. PCC 7305]|uniref:allophanate hydrolase-related protein n=1 Tax=Xenococcus sp. PCC 7305 TaxID=102125 RepID=UPI0002ACFF03|nr:gamma-glutamylcyclotransferase [Xenococcus sp. PCC 7305]ELS00680.1 AIG2-like family protein [Xenococcus sp. PCC 7305]